MVTTVYLAAAQPVPQDGLLYELTHRLWSDLPLAVVILILVLIGGGAAVALRCLAPPPTAPMDDLEICRTCEGPNDDGEGWDGQCGPCADALERARWDARGEEQPTVAAAGTTVVRSRRTWPALYDPFLAPRPEQRCPLSPAVDALAVWYLLFEAAKAAYEAWALDQPEEQDCWEDHCLDAPDGGAIWLLVAASVIAVAASPPTTAQTAAHRHDAGASSSGVAPAPWRV